MNSNSTGVPSRRRLPSRWTRLAVAQFLTGSLIAGTVTASAVPALASPSQPARSTASAARAVASRPAPLPRAFFGLGPASKTQIDGRPYFNWGASPGAGLTDHVAIVDFGATPVTVQVFVTNAVSTSHGGTGFLPPAQARGGPASWVTIHFPNGSSTLQLAPRSKVIVPITVVIPKNAPPGDHVGAIVASLSSVIQSKNHAKVHFFQQVADRIITRVSGPLHPRLSIVGLRVSYNDPVNPVATSPATLTFTVSNTGNVLLGGRVSVSVHGLFGSTETRTNVVTVPVMLPDGSDDARVTVNGVYPELLMNGKVTVTPTIVTGQYDLGLKAYAGQASFVAVPWIPLAILILLVLLAVWTWVRRRRRRHAAAATVPGGPSPVESSSGASSSTGSSSTGSSSGASSSGASAAAE